MPKGKRNTPPEISQLNALEQIGIDTKAEIPTLTEAQVVMAARAARTLRGQDRPTRGVVPVAVDPAMLESLATIHCRMAEMCLILGVSESVLNQPINKAIIAQGEAKGKRALRMSQWKAALGGNVTAQIWLGKNELNQTDVVATEVSGPNGGPIQVESPRVNLMDKVNQIVERRMLGLRAGDAQQIVGDDNTDTYNPEQ